MSKSEALTALIISSICAAVAIYFRFTLIASLFTGVAGFALSQLERECRS